MVTTWAAPVQVVTVTEDFASITKSIGGEHVEVSSLVKGSRNLHAIHPKPSMVVTLKKADLLVRIGMSQDTWVDGVIQVARNRQVLPGGAGYLDASVGVTKLEVPQGKLDGRHGDVHQEGNPHYWLNPNNGIVIAYNIAERLSQIDPNNASVYQKNYHQFKHRLETRIAVWKQQLQSLQTTRFVTYHTVWSYFFDAFQLKGVGQLEPIPGVPPTTRHLSRLKTKLHSKKEPVLVMTSCYYPQRMGALFAKEMNARYVASLPTNVGDKGINSYMDLFDEIVRKLQP